MILTHFTLLSIPNKTNSKQQGVSVTFTQPAKKFPAVKETEDSAFTRAH
jgi:hypothetical protein